MSMITFFFPITYFKSKHVLISFFILRNQIEFRKYLIVKFNKIIKLFLFLNNKFYSFINSLKKFTLKIKHLYTHKVSAL